MVTILFPGRHHMLTQYQYNYLRDLVDSGVNGQKVDKIIFAVTSSDHANTRRNPIPLYLRSVAIEKFSRDLPCETKICAIPDVKSTPKFAEFMLRFLDYKAGEALSPAGTVLACSTPSVISQFKELGFSNLPVELSEKKEEYNAKRPWEVVEELVKSGKDWRRDPSWRKHASQASIDLFLQYDLGSKIVELFQDLLLNPDADITDTRDYNTYTRGMNQNAEFKFRDIKPFVREGKIVDVGCGTGALEHLLAKEFEESDIIGIEATRTFYEFCKSQQYPSPFVFFYRKNILDQNFKENSIDTFIFSSVLHEVYSYINVDTLRQVLRDTNRQLAHHGRIIIRDVVGPDTPNKEVYMELTSTDGKSRGEIDELSTRARFDRFVADFKPRKIEYEIVQRNGKEMVRTNLRNAYEFMSKMTYTDNWHSEMHEEFGFWNFSDWTRELQEAGFSVAHGSKPFSSQYIFDNMYSPRVKLFSANCGNGLVKEPYPYTNMILCGEKQ